MKTNDVSLLWDALGSFWGDFEDKPLIEEIWQGYYDIISGLDQRSLSLRNSISFRNMEAVLQDKHETFDVVYSVNSPDYSGIINTYEVSGVEGTRHEYDLTPGTISIPELTYRYYTTSGTLSSEQTLVEGTDYYIQDMQRLRFVGSPPFIPNLNQAHFNANQLFADTVYRTNPAIWGIESSRAYLSESTLSNNVYEAYDSVGIAPGVSRDLVDAEHFKFLVWGLQNALGRQPTVSNIKHLYEIAAGFPFSHNSGIYYGGAITGDQQEYTMTGVTCLLSTNTSYDSGDAPLDDTLWIQKPTFEVGDKGWEITAKFVDAEPDYKNTLFSAAVVQPPDMSQILEVYYYDGWYFMDIKSEYDVGKPQSNLVSGLGTDYPPDEWHKFRVEISGTSGAAFYIDDDLIGSTTMTEPWEYVTPSGNYTYLAGYAENSGVFPTIYTRSAGAHAYLGYFRTYNVSGVETSFVRFIPRSEEESAVDQEMKYFIDQGPNEYACQTGDKNPGPEYPWGNTDITLRGYAVLDEGDSIDQFQVLYRGNTLNDFINNYPLISGLTDFDIEKYRHISISNSGLLPVEGFPHDSTILCDLLEAYIPKHLTYGVNEHVPSGIFIAPWGIDSNNGTRQEPVATFAQAATLVPIAGTIWYRQGTYDERIRTASLANSGLSWTNPLRIKAFPGEHVKLIDTSQHLVSPNDPIVGFDLLGSGYVSVEGFDIDGLNISRKLVGMGYTGSKYGKLYNCIVHGNASNPGNSSITFSEDGHRVERCKIYNDSWKDHHGIYVSTYGPSGRTCKDGVIANNELYGHDYSIHMNVEDWILQIEDLNIHHNYVHDSSVGILINGGDVTYCHNNLIEDCGWGIALGFSRQTVQPVVVNNTIRRCTTQSGFTMSAYPCGIFMGQGTHASSTQGDADDVYRTSGVIDICVSGYIANNTFTDCFKSYYDTSGVVDPNNHYNVHEYNMADDAYLPVSGYTTANTNIISGLIFYYKFQTAEVDKDLRLHPYFSSGVKTGADLTAYSGIEDINLDYSGILRVGYSGWDLGAYEAIV